MNSTNEHGTTATGMLRVVAWLSLVGGIVAAVLLWSNSSTTSVNTSTFTTTEETNPFIIGMGFVAAFQSMVIWCVLMAFAEITEASRGSAHHLSKLRSHFETNGST